MSLTVTQRPNQYNSWVAGFNPVLYKMTRKDFAITAVADSGGALQITVSTNLTTLTTAQGGPVIAGSILWVQTDDGVYSNAYTVVTCTNAASSVVTFTAGTYTSASTTGYINLQQRTGYNVEVEIYAGNGTASTTALFTMSFTPDKYGVLTMDISSLHNYLTPEISGAVNIYNSLGNDVFKVVPNVYTNYQFYIKYTEVWTNSAESQTSDSGNVSYIVLASRQIGDTYGGYLKEYSETTANKFLNLFTAPKMWVGKKFVLSFIDPTASSTSRTHVKKTRYLSDGTLWGSTYDLQQSTFKGIYDSVETLTTPYGLYYDQQSGSGTSWTNNTVIGITVGASSKGKLFPISFPVGTKTITIDVNWSVDTATTARIDWSAVDLSDNTLLSGSLGTHGSGTYAETVSIDTSSLSGTMYFLKLIVVSVVGTTTVTLNSVKLNDIPEEGTVVYSIVTLTKPAFPITETTVSEALTCYVQEEVCTPAIQLMWKNNLGGEQTWIFQYNQTRSSKIKDSKNIRLLCYADGITENEFEVIDQLNTVGELYNPAITELTTSVNKTQARSGQQVYLIDADGNEAGSQTGVIVIPSEFSYMTKRKSYNAEILIELPAKIIPS